MSLQVGIAPEFNLRNANTAGNESNHFLIQWLRMVALLCLNAPLPICCRVGRINNMAGYCNVNGIGFVGINATILIIIQRIRLKNMVKRAEKGCLTLTFTMQHKK